MPTPAGVCKTFAIPVVDHRTCGCMPGCLKIGTSSDYNIHILCGEWPLMQRQTCIPVLLPKQHSSDTLHSIPSLAIGGRGVIDWLIHTSAGAGQPHNIIIVSPTMLARAWQLAVEAHYRWYLVLKHRCVVGTLRPCFGAS